MGEPRRCRVGRVRRAGVIGLILATLLLAACREAASPAAQPVTSTAPDKTGSSEPNQKPSSRPGKERVSPEEDTRICDAYTRLEVGDPIQDPISGDSKVAYNTFPDASIPAQRMATLLGCGDLDRFYDTQMPNSPGTMVYSSQIWITEFEGTPVWMFRYQWNLEGARNTEDSLREFGYSAAYLTDSYTGLWSIMTQGPIPDGVTQALGLTPDIDLTSPMFDSIDNLEKAGPCKSLEMSVADSKQDNKTYHIVDYDECLREAHDDAESTYYVHFIEFESPEAAKEFLGAAPTAYQQLAETRFAMWAEG